MEIATSGGPTPCDVARSGVDGWACFRIPALAVAPNGDLLAFFDGRPTEADLPSPIDLLMRRSTDGGQTWQPIEVVRPAADGYGYGDPSVVVDRVTGAILLFHAATQNHGFFSASTGADHDDPEVQQADLSVSTDQGKSWTHHRITDQLKQGRDDWAGLFAASGEGIQLRHGDHRGRLLQQYVVNRPGVGIQAVSAWSDDHGHSWHTSDPVGPDADENKVVELADGTVLLNARATPLRRQARSADGGQSYGPLIDEPQLPDPANNGSIIRAFPDAEQDDPRAQILLFSNTADPQFRRALTVRASCDSGVTWTASRVVETESAAYSTLTPLPDQAGELGGGGFGLLYERQDYGQLCFVRFDLDWLTGSASSS